MAHLTSDFGIQLLHQLPEKRLGSVRQIASILQQSGHECYMVGGAVRDLIMNRPAGDIDLATDAHPETVQKLFHRTIPTGIDHGTITVRMGGESFEVTTYRADSQYTDARRPDRVSFSRSLSEDLMRRDFTVNAIALDPISGEMRDEHGGLDDIQSRLIRTIGLPEERFFEDGLRPVRACRFCASLDFTVEESTYRALGDEKIHHRTSLVAVERFTDEIKKGFRSKHLSAMIRCLEDTGILALFLGRFLPEYFSGTLDKDLQILDDIHSCSADFRIALYFRILGLNTKEILEEIGKHLKLSRHMVRDLHYHNVFLDFQLRSERERRDPPSPGAVRRFLSPLKEVYGEDLLDHLDGAFCDCNFVKSYTVGWNEIRETVTNHPLVIRDLTVDGKDLMALGIRGKQLGETLRRLLDLVLENPDRNESKELLSLLPFPAQEK